MAMDAISVIRTKRDRGRLSDEQIDWVIDAYTRGVVADEQIRPNRDPGRAELLDLLAKPRRVDDHAVADDRRDLRLQDAGGQQRQLERPVPPDDGVPRVRPAVVPDHEVVPVGQEVDDLPLRLVPPLQPDDARGGHKTPGPGRRKPG